MELWHQKAYDSILNHHSDKEFLFAITFYVVIEWKVDGLVENQLAVASQVQGLNLLPMTPATSLPVGNKCKIKWKSHKFTLKMLGLYLYTLTISHNSCKMLSILNKLTLQKDLQNIVTNNVFMDKK